MKRIASSLLICLGISCFLLAAYLYWQQNDPNRLTFLAYTAHPPIKQQKNNVPREIIIRNQNIDLPIYTAVINHTRWETTTNGVSYLSSSPIPGAYGNSILYGHNWNNLLGRLPYVKPGENIEIYYNDHSKKIFTVMYTAIVSPDQTHILDMTTDRRITLYTCTGFLDMKRFVAVAIEK